MTFQQRAGTIFLSFLLLTVLSGCHHPTVIDPHYPAPDLAMLNNHADPYEVQLWALNNNMRIGDLLQLEMRSMAAGYLSFYAISSSGKIYQLFANQPVAAGAAVTFPGQEYNFQFRLSPPEGNEVYILCSTTRRLEWLAPDDILRDGPLTVLNMNRQQFLSRLSMSLNRHHKNEWNTTLLELRLQVKQ